MRYESENVYTKRKDNAMYGLFSRVTFLEGHDILNLRSGDKVAERDFRSIELDDGHYMHPDGMFTNHSCNPTAFVSKWSGMLVAARDIFPGDEITFNYLESETEIAGEFECNCGADNCVGQVSTSRIDLWCEGYAATGNFAPAKFCGTYTANTLRDAVEQFAETISESDASLINLDSTPPTFWGCRFYDNEADARASFG